MPVLLIMGARPIGRLGVVSIVEPSSTLNANLTQWNSRRDC